ncbi:LOG family protein [Bermanella marisrubri]|uniref:AMP nucleosidase n=1 Tax=Bermanella marisrubri TaxID=207949 RepID=Q1N0B3_9GAMM|nr:nucleotide 5'-monophosphate nucleosidase PpnN [Bermanella marisrubri]EAT11604.1 decarboxylase family protein [Oceanobacter sp. RED65] [Bermanella marisrubri]QIZ83351.1 LOG family protein [Bermanella marisrubri]
MTVKHARISPKKALRVLSRHEVNRLKDATQSGLHEVFKRCAYAVLNCGSQSDDYVADRDDYNEFDIQIIQLDRGIVLDLFNAPDDAFVDGELIYGIREHLFAVLRDIVYTHDEIINNTKFITSNESSDQEESEQLTNIVFHILRNANVLRYGESSGLVICWGGHSISREEYDYSKRVGYQLGLRGMDVGTGCGPGAMKGPMKGATIGHAKQHNKTGRYVGITEPGIIAAESPNPIVNELVILPDIEKRLEAFVRCCHGIIVFPGGAGTAEEIQYLLGILLHPKNKDIPFPVIFSGPESAREYFTQIDAFIGTTLGKEAQEKYQIIIDDPAQVSIEMNKGIQKVTQFRRENSDAFYFNWMLNIDKEFQTPFIPTHENMGKLNLNEHQEPHILAANLRRAFSGIVAGNVKEEGILEVRAKGPFKLHGDASIIEPMGKLLESMVKQQRMKLPGSHYVPCYEIVS